MPDHDVEALGIRLGVPDAYAVAMDAWEAAGATDHLPEPIRHYVAVTVMINEVENGSFCQYFSNSYGRDVGHALKGLHAIGAKGSAAVVRKAVALFGTGGPSPNQDTRQQELDRIEADALERLSDALLKGSEELRFLLVRHAAKHRDYFVRR